MRMLRMVVVGIVALLGAPALADLPAVNEARVTWQGCDYSIKVLQDVNPDPYPQPFYRISVQSEVVSPGTCTLTPQTVELATSKLVPQIAIVASAEGLVVAYSYGEYIRYMGNWVRISLRRLDPSTLASVRVAGLAAHRVPDNGGAGAPGAAYLGDLTLHSGYLEVNGSLTGNSLTEDPPTVPYPYPTVQGSRFVAIYPDFFTTQRSPLLVTF